MPRRSDKTDHAIEMVLGIVRDDPAVKEPCPAERNPSNRQYEQAQHSAAGGRFCQHR